MILREYWEFLAGVLASAYAVAAYTRRRIQDPVVRRSEMMSCEKRICNHQNLRAKELSSAIQRVHERLDMHLNSEANGK